MFLFYRTNVGYFKWVKTYWFFIQSNWNKLSNIFYGLSILLFLLSLLDLRGPETKVRTSLPDQRTIIVLDSSLSMLSEDVRPNRFIKSIQIARHFIKSAAGHQIAIVLFSDLQKRLIPFTDDIDLLDSRLAALEKANAVSGGTNISQAITEAAGYFESDSSKEAKEEGGGGNILVFTDAEEGEDNFKMDISKNINLALVGVGTAKGGEIPLRWDDGSSHGYKMVKGQNVITRLDENYIKSIGKNVKNFRYWIANSYSLPTEEIMDFFRATYNQKNSNGDMRVRPVFSHYILIPAILIYCLSVVFGRLNSFRSIGSILFIFILAGKLMAEEKPELSPELKKDLNQIRQGKAARVEILKTAEKLLRAKEDEKALDLYSEYSQKNDNETIRFNYATSLLKKGNTNEALPIVQELLSKSQNEDLKNKMRNNLTVAIKKIKQDKEKKQDEKKDDKKEDKQNSKNNQKQNKDSSKSGTGKDDKKSQEQSKEQKQEKDKQDKEKKEQEKKEEKKKQDEKKAEQDNKKPEEKPQTLEQKEKDIEQKRRMTKTPGMIKQIMSDDRELQKKLMDTTTKEKGELKPKRDW
jgi:Ca-activated chloride channel family protein